MQYSFVQVISLSHALILDDERMSGHTVGSVCRAYFICTCFHNVVDYLAKVSDRFHAIATYFYH